MLAHNPRDTYILRNSHASSPHGISLPPISISAFIVSIFIFYLPEEKEKKKKTSYCNLNISNKDKKEKHIRVEELKRGFSVARLEPKITTQTKAWLKGDNKQLKGLTKYEKMMGWGDCMCPWD